MAISLDKIESLAPDQASLDAARKLLKPTNWPTLAVGGQDLAWGECQGSGSTPYRVVICESDAGFKCSCPSRKFPCKHSLALMWLRSEGKVNFTPGPIPDWVESWLSRRRGPSESGDDKSAKPKASIKASAAAQEGTPDPKDDAKAAAARERKLKERESSVLAGLEELDTWLTDQVDKGIASFVNNVTELTRMMAQRLVDAKASGLATRLDSLPARLFAFPDAQRPLLAIQELAQFHLLAEAYRRQDSLSPALKADVRQMIGWNLTREQLLADASALRIQANWRVIATNSITQVDRLIRHETWLFREAATQAPYFALFLDFVPLATGVSRSIYSPGESIPAELVFYPGALPMRALIAQQSGATQPATNNLGLPDLPLETAFAGYEQALAQKPWLETWPLAFGQARLRRIGEQYWLCSKDATLTLPCASEQENLYPLVALESFAGIALWDGHYARLWWAETPLGTWMQS